MKRAHSIQVLLKGGGFNSVEIDVQHSTPVSEDSVTNP